MCRQASFKDVIITETYCDFLAEDARDTRTDVSVRVFEDKFLTEEVQIKRMVVKFKGSFANEFSLIHILVGSVKK